MSLLVVLRLLGLIIPFGVPTGAMTPAISAGDRVIMEGATFLFRSPKRGDIVVFKTDRIALKSLIPLPPSDRYLKRVVGEPGERLLISGGQLYINDQPVMLTNAYGPISFDVPPNAGGSALTTNLTVPEDCYFVLGDNSLNSLDSRYFGAVPRASIVGRIWLCYSPAERRGRVR